MYFQNQISILISTLKSISTSCIIIDYIHDKFLCFETTDNAFDGKHQKICSNRTYHKKQSALKYTSHSLSAHITLRIYES